MAASTSSEAPRPASLQKQAIEDAKLAYSRLPHGDEVLQQSLDGKETLAEVFRTTEQKCQAHAKKKSSQRLEKFEKYTAWLQNISSVVDIAVQTQAGIACPLWSPIKLVLKVSNDHSKATQQVIDLLALIAESLPRFELYEQLQSHSLLQIALLNVFSDVMNFAVRAYRFFRQNTLVRLVRVATTSFRQDIGTLTARLERHARAADQTAIAAELVAASEFRKESERRQAQDLKIQCEKWLKPSSVKHIHQFQVEAKLAGTCRWIDSHSAFEKWMKALDSSIEDRLLIISGPHGRGKSVMASSVVMKLESEGQHTTFFTFSNSDGNRHQSENLLRTFVWHLISNFTSREGIDTVFRQRVAGQPTVSELWDLLESVSLLLASPVYCIIDGIDECSDFGNGFMTKTIKLVGTCPKLRILLLGRPHVLQDRLESAAFLTIDLTSTLLRQDIDAFIHHQISKSSILSLPGLREAIHTALKDNSDGMFLWVKLMIDELQKSSSRFEVIERLHDLPLGLESAYRLTFLRISQTLDKYELRLAQHLLISIIVACRPLRYDELRYVHALQCKSTEVIDRPLDQFLLLQPPQRVLKSMEGMICMTDGFLHLTHSSVRDFLVRPKDRWEIDSVFSDFRIDITEAQRSFSWLCLDYIRLEKKSTTSMTDFYQPSKNDELSLDAQTSEGPRPNRKTANLGCKLSTAGSYEGNTTAEAAMQNIRDRYPFLDYAILYTFHHLNRSGSLCSTTLAKIQDVFESEQSILWLEMFTHLQFEDLTLRSQLEEYLNLQKVLADTGLDNQIFSIFAQTVKRVRSQKQSLEEDTSLKTKDFPKYIDIVSDEDLEAFYKGECLPESEEISENPPDVPCVSSQYQKADISITISRIGRLLKSHGSLPLSYQVELFLRLTSALRKTRVLVDPLKVLFQLILSKSSSISVYAFIPIAGFYFRLYKYQEAFEVYNVASKKLDHVNTYMKFWIYFKLAICCDYLDLEEERLQYHELAFNGCQALFGIRHYDTIRAFYHTLKCYAYSRLPRETLDLYDKFFQGQDFIPDLDTSINLAIQRMRYTAYLNIDDRERAYDIELCMKKTLRNCRVNHTADSGEESAVNLEICITNYKLGHFDLALEAAQLAFETIKKSVGPNHPQTLRAQFWLIIIDRHHGLGEIADDICEDYLARSRIVKGPNHSHTRRAEELLHKRM